jgi:two-component system, chemotaxis family, chemotaxis protein CheY
MPPNILVVDDNASIRYLIRSLLENTGYAVCGEAEDGADAIEKAKQLKPDLICLDLSMPRMNGAEAASVLKRLMPAVPIISVHHARGQHRSIPSENHWRR